jgi:hypothetical protein
VGRRYLRRGRLAIEIPTPEKRKEGGQNCNLLKCRYTKTLFEEMQELFRGTGVILRGAVKNL